MAMKIDREQIWEAGIPDRPGGLAKKLQPLADAGAKLKFVLARRSPGKPGRGVVFVTPLQGAKQLRAARSARFKKSRKLHGLRLEGPDKRGLGAALAAALGDAGINLRGLAAASVANRRCIIHLAVDSAKDAAKAVRVLGKLR